MSDSGLLNKSLSKSSRRRRHIIEDDEDEEPDNIARDSDEDDEGQDEFEKDGFLVSDDEVEEEEPSHHRKKIKKKRRNLSDEELDEDDLDLIKENAGISFEQPKPKLKRLQKKNNYDTEEEHYSEEIDYQQDHQNRADDLHGMFDDEEDQPLAETYSADDLDDFIEHDGADNAEDAEDPDDLASRRQLAKKRRMEQNRLLRESGVDVGSHELLAEIFGDGGDYDYAMHEPVKTSNFKDDLVQNSLKNVFEPAELEARMLTGQDEIITHMDAPERMQALYGANIEKPLDETDLNAEFEWIYSRFYESCDSEPLKHSFRNPTTADLIRKAVKACIEFFNTEQLEVPFIWHYRKDYLLDPKSNLSDLKTVLQLEDLWKIYDIGKKYKAFNTQLDGFNKTLYNFEAEGRMDSYVQEQRYKTQRVEEAQDILDYINSRFIPKEVPQKKGEERIYRRPNSNSFLDRCKRANIDNLVGEFGITPQQFGDNALEGSKVHHPINPNCSPIDIAKRHVSSFFPTAELVLKGVETYIVDMMFHDLKLRQAFRQTFENNSAVSIQPTARGVREMDSTHRFFHFKFLNEKPILYMKDAQFLQMLEAESLGLVKVTISLPGENVFLANLIRLYLCEDSSSPHAHAWNQTRSTIVTYACERHLFPYFKNWIRDKLRTQAEEYLFRACQKEAENKFNSAPYRSASMDPDTIPRVIALTNGTGSFRDPTLALFLESNGQLEETVEFGDLRDTNNRDLLASFFKRHPCDVIVVAGLNHYVRFFYEKVRSLYEELYNLGDLGNSPQCEVILHTDEVARVYQSSQYSEEEFPNVNKFARYCISLARLFQDPLVEYASLKENLANISFHPLQELLPKEQLLASLERALINIVNSTGIDLNRAVRNGRVGHLLQYISGLGPRKSQYILKKISDSGHHLDSRNELITRCRVGMRVFINCSGFLKVKPAVDVLDITRIHPEDYVLARKMAADALEADDEDDPEDPSKNVAELINNPQSILNDLDLEDYSRVLARKYQTQKQSTLSLIKTELRAPFADPRPQFKPTHSKVLFSQLTGETSASLCVQMIVPVEVRRILGSGVLCELNSGIEGFLSSQNTPNSNSLSPGSVVQCAVLSINFERFRVELSLSPADLEKCRQGLKDFYSPSGPGLDEFFDYPKFQDELLQHPEIYPNFPRPTPVIKNIALPNEFVVGHRLYRNFTYKEAEGYLKPRPDGTVVVRPSSQGHNHITVSWKMYPDIYQHLDVIVVKQGSDSSHAWNERNYHLRLNDDTYIDIDELVVMYVGATKAKVDEMVNFSKFHKGNLANLEEVITATSLTNPKQSVYGFCINNQYAGYFNLGFKLSSKSRFEVWLVKAVPRYFRLNNVAYPDVVSLVTGFKHMITAMTTNRAAVGQMYSSRPHSFKS